MFDGFPFVPNLLGSAKRSGPQIRAFRERALAQLYATNPSPAAVPEQLEELSDIDRLMKQPVRPRVDEFDELLKQPVKTPAEREATEVFEELLRRRPTVGVLGRVIGRALGPIGAAIELAIPSELGSGEAEVRGDFPLPDPPVIPPPPPPAPVALPEPLEPPPPPIPLPPLPLPLPSTPGPGLTRLPRSRRQLRQKLRKTAKDRIRDLLLTRFLPFPSGGVLPDPAPRPAAAPSPSPFVGPLPLPETTPRPTPTPRSTQAISMPGPLTGLGLGRLSLPRTAPSSAPGMSDSCTQCAIDKCVQSAMDKQRRSRRKKGPKRRKQQKLCVSAPRSLSALLKLLK